MDPVVWAAIAGVAGTLLAPLLTERARRNSARRQRLGDARLDAYTDLLLVTARLAENASTWSAIPLADPQETGQDELDRVIARVRIVASPNVYDHLDQITGVAGEFHRALLQAKLDHRAVHTGGRVDDGRTILQRLDLGKLADRLRATHRELEAMIRAEVGR